jgi:haloacetate dehalogenase
VDFFTDFDEWDLPGADTGDGHIMLHGRSAGSGPPLVLLHGHPRTHTTWHMVAPLLVDAGCTVVCPDLRGYGRSTSPPRRPDHAQASKRVMAADIVAAMRALGHDTFAVAGHDRGSYVAYRCALDHPSVVTALAVLDCVPIAEALARADARFATQWWHWFFFAQEGKPERAILADPLRWYGNGPEKLGQRNYEDYARAVTDPDTVVAMLEDYRAGLGIDRSADEVDQVAGRRVSCPMLVAWSRDDDMEQLYGDVPAVWQPWTQTPPARAVLNSGHHMAEEAPTQLADELASFLRHAGILQRTG